MNSVNISILTGRLGKDPEIRVINENLSVCKCVIATDFSWWSKKKQNDDGTTGGWESETTWHKIVLWNPGKKLAEAKKGAMVHFEGRYADNIWEDDNGNKHYDKEMRADKHWVLPAGDGRPFQTEKQKQQRKETNQPTQEPDPFQYAPPPGVDDLPFS